MKRQAFAFSLAVLILPLVFSNCPGRGQGPGIRFSSDKYDFGSVAEGTSVQHTFEFTNDGTENLIVSEVYPTCGCTVAGDFDKIVPPGGTGKIPITFDSTGFEGPETKTVVVKTNASGNPEHTLTIVGTVKVLIGTNPNILWFGNIERDRTKALEGSMTLTSRLPGPVEISGVKPEDGNVEASVRTIKAGAEFSLSVKVKPPFKEGPVKGAVRLKTNNIEIPEFTAYYSYYLVPMVAAFPDPLYVSRKNIEQGDELTINIECQPGPDVRIENLIVNDDKVNVASRQITGDPKKGKRFVLTVKFPRDFQFDPHKAPTITFRAKNAPNEPVVSIPILEGRE